MALSATGSVENTYRDQAGLLVSTIDPAELGANTSVWCTTQSEDGTLFFGGDELLVYTGETWSSYKMGEAYAIRSLDFGTDGRLWAAAVNEIGWFQKRADGGWDYQSIRAKLPEAIYDLGEVWKVYAINDGALFVTQSKIIQLKGDKFTWWDYNVSRRLIPADNSKALYVSNRNSGLLRISSNEPELVYPINVIGSSSVFWIGEANGKTVFATSAGVGTIEDGQLEYADQALSEYLTANILTTARSLADGTLALGTLKGGLVIVGSDLHLQQVIGVKNGLPTDEVYSIHQTQGGALWVTSSTNIFQIKDLGNITVFDQRHGLPKAGGLKIITHNGQPIILNKGGVYQPDSSTHGFARKDAVLGAYRDILSTPSGLNVAGNYGVIGLQEEARLSYHTTPHDVFKIGPSPSIGSYYASENRQIIQFSTTGAPSHPITNQLPDISDGFVSDSKGRLWISTVSEGLHVATPSADGPVDAEPANLHHGFPHSKGYPKVATLADTVIATGPEEAYWLNPDTDQFEAVANYPSGETISLSNADAQGRIWAAIAGMQKGMPARLGQLERTAHGVRWIPRSVGGLTTAGRPRALHVEITEAGNTLWIAGSNALLRVTQPETMVARPPSKPLLNATVHDDPTAPGQPITTELPYSTKRLHLQFSSTDYGNRDALRYQTMLSGVDRDWSKPTNTPRLELANLREGNYSFKVRVIANTGLVSQATELRFSIATPWWRTPSAYGGYALLIGITLTGLYRLRVRTIRQRAELLEQTVRLRTNELEKANAAKTEFVASMSHEIRNPMNGIIGSAHALDQTELSKEQRHLVSTLNSCATFLGSLVEDVLDFSSIEAGAFKVQQQPCYPRTILESVSNMLSGQAVIAGAHFELEVDAELPTQILADASRVQQILVNYATNALKFSGGGRVRLSAYTDNNNIAFAVTDNGPGISTDEQAVLFTRFSRLKTARNAGVAGTGLGLAVCRAIAEKMGGSVGVASAPRRGATFFLRIPLQTASANDHTPKLALPSMEGARALVVEDIDYNARALNIMLKQLGFTVDLAPDGATALKHLSTRAYHAVFLDYDLPDMSGLDIARRLRLNENEESKALVIATTAYSTVEDRRACLEAGMDVFLGKPITPEKLQTVLAGMPPIALPSASIDLPIDPSGLNLRMLNYLADNQPDGLKREIKRYLDSLTATHGEILEALLTRNRPALSKAAHRMLSHARMVEATTLTTITEELETEADYAENRRLEELGDELSAAITELRKMLVRHHQAQTPA